MTEDIKKPGQERSGRKKEGIFILIILLIVCGLTVVGTRITPFGIGFPLSSTVIMFILININLLLLLTLFPQVYKVQKQYSGFKAKDPSHHGIHRPGTASNHCALLFFNPVYLHLHCILV